MQRDEQTEAVAEDAVGEEYPVAEEAAGVLPEEEPVGRAERFDPTPYMRQLRGRGGGGEYLDVKWRLLWLRKEHPDAEIVTEHVQIEPTAAIFKATVTLPGGGKATGYGSETAGDFGDFIEKAETKAIGRALNALGYGAQFGDRGDDEAPPRPAARPFPDPLRAGDRPTRLPERPLGRPTAGAPPAAAPATLAPRVVPADDGPDGAAGQGVEENAAAGFPAHRTQPAGDGAAPVAEADPDLADYSWTAFWPWARGLGLNGPQAVEAVIGQSTAGLSPARLRELIVQANGGG